jgi:hypothetical protein
MNKHLIKEAKAGAAALRWDGKYSEADAIDSLADEVKHYESKRQERSTLKKGDKVVMHTCMEANNPKYLGRIWTCKTDAYRNKGYDYDVIFLEGFSGSFAAEFLQKVNVSDDTEIQHLREENAAQAEEIKKLQTYMYRVLSFYGTGLSVLNWHDNGDSEPWDSFFDDNMDAEDIERLRKLEG